MIKAILLDIEGTTTPIDFVHKTLFPYSKNKIGDFVRRNWDEVQSEISQLSVESLTDTSYDPSVDSTSPASIASYLEFLIGVDRKSTPLKSMQGRIWQSGYQSGELKSIVFEDVERAFIRWQARGLVVAIYSSGSVLAQRLIFRYSDRGDLTPFISEYFDTNVGGKREAASYAIIAKRLTQLPNEVLFVSDVTAELDAARLCGLSTALAVRDGNASPDVDNSHQPVMSFDDLG